MPTITVDSIQAGNEKIALLDGHFGFPDNNGTLTSAIVETQTDADTGETKYVMDVTEEAYNYLYLDVTPTNTTSTWTVSDAELTSLKETNRWNAIDNWIDSHPEDKLSLGALWHSGISIAKYIEAVKKWCIDNNHLV